MSENEKDELSDDILDVISGKKKKEQKKHEKDLQKKLTGILPKKIDDEVKKFADEVKEVQEGLEVKRASALGLSLVNILKNASKNTDETVETEEKIKVEIVNDLNFSTVIEDIVSKVIDKDDKYYDQIFQLAVGALYKYIKEDLIKVLSRELDNMKGKIKYYGAEYNYIGGGGGEGGCECDCQELYDEIDRLNQIIDDLLEQLPCPVYRTWGDFSTQTWCAI